MLHGPVKSMMENSNDCQYFLMDGKLLMGWWTRLLCMNPFILRLDCCEKWTLGVLLKQLQIERRWTNDKISSFLPPPFERTLLFNLSLSTCSKILFGIHCVSILGYFIRGSIQLMQHSKKLDSSKWLLSKNWTEMCGMNVLILCFNKKCKLKHHEAFLAKWNAHCTYTSKFLETL